MTIALTDLRRQAIDSAIGSNALSGYHTSDFGKTVFERWIHGHWTTDEAVAIVIQHYKENPCADSDSAARKNQMGLTDSHQLRVAEADITTLRIADLQINPV